MSLSRAAIAILVGAAPLRASRPASSCPPNAECAADATNWVNFVQTRYVHNRHKGAAEQPGAQGVPKLSPQKKPAIAEADPAGVSRKLRSAQHKPEPIPEPLSAVSTGATTQQHKNGPKDAGWFQGFSEAESTFDTDGELTSFGWDSSNWAPDEETRGPLATKPTPKPGEWFQETESGGPTEAWQTFYPSVSEAASRGLRTLPWRDTVYDGYQQEAATFRPEEQAIHWSQDKENKGPMWFDTAVGTYDAFGRARAPSDHSQRRYIEWDRRTKKVNLTCGSVGCVANASFPQLFNHTEEQRRMCLLSIAVHATDFDDEYSRERVEFFKANGETVGVNCNPMAQGNTAEAQNALYPCITELDVDNLIKDDGQLSIEGKLNDRVDEFPRDGNLLDGEATVSCLVRKRPSWQPEKPMPLADKIDNTVARALTGQSISKRFGCTQPGCVAEALFEFGQSALKRTCKLTVKITQTDFDGSLGTDEQVEFLKVNGKTLKQGVKPGGNPCKRAAELGQTPPAASQLLQQSQDPSNATNGTNVSDDEGQEEDLTNGTNASNTSEENASEEDPDIFLLVDGEDVSEDVQNSSGTISITSKISDMVDECGHEGFLLSGIAIVSCEVSEQDQKIIEADLEGASDNDTAAGNASDASASGEAAEANGSAANASEAVPASVDDSGGSAGANASDASDEGAGANGTANASEAEAAPASSTDE